MYYIVEDNYMPPVPSVHKDWDSYSGTEASETNCFVIYVAM